MRAELDDAYGQRVNKNRLSVSAAFGWPLLTPGFAEADPSVAVWSEREPVEFICGRVVVAVGEDLAQVVTLFGLDTQIDVTLAGPEVCDCEHGTAGSAVYDSKHGPFAGIDVVTLARAKLGTLAQRMERSAEPRQKRVRVAFLMFDIDGRVAVLASSRLPKPRASGDGDVWT